MEMVIKQLSGNDVDQFTEMLVLFGEVFEMKNCQMPAKSYLESLLKSPNFAAFIAVSDDRVVGGLTGHVIPSYYFGSSEFYVYDVAVKSTHQRQGIGKKLMACVAAFCREQNFTEYFVQADEPDEHAIEFYRSTGGRPKRVVHFYYPVNLA